MPLDLHISPLYRINGQEPATMPGLLAVTPPRKAARGREQDRFIAYLTLTGTAVFTTSEYFDLVSSAATAFFQTPGAMTAALRAATETVNQALLGRNIKSSALGQYAMGWLSMAILRDTTITLSLSGPMNVHILNNKEARHIYEPGLSGKGLGLGKNAVNYFTQIQIEAGDRLLISGRVPAGWNTILNTPGHAALENMRRKLLAETSDDLHAILMQSTSGKGILGILQGKGETIVEPQEKTPEPAPQVQEAITEAANTSESAIPQQPSAYSIPAASTPEPEISTSGVREFPPSIPRLKPRDEGVSSTQPVPTTPPIEINTGKNEATIVVPPEIQKQTEPSDNVKKVAQVMVRGIRASRRANEKLGDGIQRFLPRLLPESETSETFFASPMFMFAVSVIIPLIVVTIAAVIFFRYGRSAQFTESLSKAHAAQEQALIITDPVGQRNAWESVLFYVSTAEEYRVTDETTALRVEAEQKRDTLLGIKRLQFSPAFSNGLGIQISRMAASETDLFMLDALSGSVMRATLTSRGLQVDAAFNCRPDTYGTYQVGALVDVLTLPLSNSINATLLGIDAAGNLLYCAPGQVAQAIPLPPPITNWGRVTAMTLDNGNLYVMDAQSSAIWVYVGLGNTFVDTPYFFFGNQIPPLQDAIDIAVRGDDLYILHADGHLSTCTYSRIEAKPTQCTNPDLLINPFPAYQDTDLFGTAHITQMIFSAPPDSSLLLLSTDNRSVFRVSPHPRAMELQNQFKSQTGNADPMPSGTAGSIAYGPNHVIYIAIDDNVFFAPVDP